MNQSFKIALIILLILSNMIPAKSIAGSLRSVYFDITIIKDTTQVKIYIDGMSCMRCAQKIEKKVGAIDGVKDVKVYLEEKYAIIVFEHKITSIETISSKIVDAGYEVTKHEVIKNKRG